MCNSKCLVGKGRGKEWCMQMLYERLCGFNKGIRYNVWETNNMETEWKVK